MTTKRDSWSNSSCWLLDYVVAILSPFFALELTLWLAQAVDLFGRGCGNFSLFYIAVFVSGLRSVQAGCVAIGLSSLLIYRTFLTWGVSSSSRVAQVLIPLGLFLLVTTTLVLLISVVQSSKRQVERLSQKHQAESRDRLSMALSAAKMGLWDWDLATGEVLWSPEHEPLLGIPPGRFDGRYETFESHVYPDDLPGLRQAIAQAIAQRVPYLHEFRVIWADGSIHWVEGWGKVLDDEAARPPTRMVGTIMAIDQRKRAEQTLHQLNVELEERVRDRTEALTRINAHLQETIAVQDRIQRQLWEQAQLLDLAHDTILTLDLDWVITFWNQGAERLYGWSKADAVGQPIMTLLHMPADASLAQIQADLMAQGYWEGELEHCDRDHRLLTLASRWVLQRDDQGKPLKILTINRDITARKQAEKALQHYAAEVEDLYNHAPCGYHSLDANGIFVRINDTELNWLGYPREAVIGKKFTDFVTPESQQTFHESFPRFKQQGWVNDVEFELIQADGSTRWVSLNATVIRDDTGRLIMSRSIMFDITERRKTDQMKQEFISVVSHELRTPLTSIRGALGLLASGVLDGNSERKQEMVAIAARQSDRLVRLVNDILDLRRLESGQTQFKFAECAMAELMQQSVDTMRSQAEQQSIQITVIPTEVRVWANADAIVQTLTNLLSNAIKFSRAGTTITLAAAPDPNDPDMIRCLVQDQGRGIPPDRLESIFGQFQQVDASDSRDKGGTGLGLAICRTIIEQHNGKIWAETGKGSSADGAGSCFYFTLPIAGAC